MSKEEKPGQAVAVHDAGATQPDVIVRLLELAIDKGIPVEALERLQALHERVSERAAAAEFAEAMAKFQAQVPQITKNREATITSSRAGSHYKYRYAELDHIARTIAPALQRNGLSYTWDSKVDASFIHVTCTVRHINGHSQSATFVCPTESAAGMSAQQKFAAALTFAQRKSLVQVLGLIATEEDTDAADHNPEPITDEQAADLAALLEENEVRLDRFLKWAGVEKLADIRADRYSDCVAKVHEVAEARGKKA